MAAPNIAFRDNPDQFAKFKLRNNNGHYSGGRYVYKKWVVDMDGNRLPVRIYDREDADLQSTYIYNQDGSEVLRYIRLDIDAIRTLSQWKDANGAVDWFKIAIELHKNFPGIIRQIEFVTRSHGGKGIHIIIGIAPLPLDDEKTKKAQDFARRIQCALIRIFNVLGIGADEAATGLKQDFASYRKTKNLIHSNPILTKRIENSAKKKAYFNDNGDLVVTYQNVKFLNNLNNDIEKGLEYLEIVCSSRLYNDMRVEPKIAKLFLFILGMYRPVLNSTSFERENSAEVDFDTFYGTPNTVELSLDQIAEIMDTEKRNIYKTFWEKDEIKRLFHVEKNIEGTYKFSLVDSKHVAKRIQRALAIWNYQPVDHDFRLIPPELVCDGFRNCSIVGWTLSLKWHGVSEEVTLQMLLELVKRISGYETSSSCKKKQLRLTVQSIFRNKRETTGIKFCEQLPDWLRPEKVLLPKNSPKPYSSSFTTTSPSRSILLPVLGGDAMSRDSLNKDQSSFIQGLPEGSTLFSFNQSFSNSKNSVISENAEDTKESKQTQHLRVVTYNHRIGFYFNGELLLCLINNRHYKLTNAVRYIEKEILRERTKFDVLKEVIHVRHNTKAYQEMALKLYKEDTITIPAQHICGYKKSYHDNMDEYGFKKAKQEGISFKEYKERLDKKSSTYAISCDSINAELVECLNEVPF